MYLQTYLMHLRARNLSPKTIHVTGEYLSLFLREHDPLTTTKKDIQLYLGALTERCSPSTVWTTWRHLKGFFGWLHDEGDIDVNPLDGVRKPIVPPTEVKVLTSDEIHRLLATCKGRNLEDRRDLAILTVMLDTGLRLSEVALLTRTDIGDDFTLRVFGKGRKWRTVALGLTASKALSRWLRTGIGTDTDALWTGTRGPLTPAGVRKVIYRRGQEAGLRIHPHQLRHTFVDNWLRNGGAEVDLARLCGWTTTRMAERYAQHRADERALTAHSAIQPLDRLST